MIESKIESIRSHLNNTLKSVLYPAPARKGKVRDIFEKKDELFLVASDRVSAFDVVLGTVPLKGAMLTEQTTFWLNKVGEIVPTHLIDRPDAQVMRCKKAQPLAVEMVVRGYLAGSLARENPETRGSKYGLKLNPHMKEFEAFETPIITPTTKAEVGEHDAPCSMDELVASGALTQSQSEEISEISMALFKTGQAFAERQNLILVDTKYEFGIHEGKVILIDEIHTADSSRYWKKDTYEGKLQAGLAPEMLDKERLRRWLISEHNYRGDGEAPALTDEIREDLSAHYWELTELLTGARFEAPTAMASNRVPALLEKHLR